MVPDAPLWTPMVHYGPMAAYGSLCLYAPLWPPYGPLLTQSTAAQKPPPPVSLMARFGLLWFPMAPYDLLWPPMGPYVPNQQQQKSVPLCLCDLFWLLMVPYGFHMAP